MQIDVLPLSYPERLQGEDREVPYPKTVDDNIWLFGSTDLSHSLFLIVDPPTAHWALCGVNPLRKVVLAPSYPVCCILVA